MLHGFIWILLPMYIADLDKAEDKYERAKTELETTLAELGDM